MKNIIKKFIPKFVISWYHLGLAYAGAVLSGFPSKKLIIIGVTGTKGKSTVIEFCHKIFQEAGFSVASMSTIRFKINDEEKQNTLKMTMPGRFRIQNFLKEAVEKGCKYAILEVTSEGIVQSRHKFIDFKTAVFTNLEPEHIERHGSFEKYKEAKGKLFEAIKNIHIINADDKNTEYFTSFSADKKYFYTIKDTNIRKEGEKVSAERISLLETGSKFFVKNKEFELKLMGEFNISNALAAICVADSEGIDLDVCKSALEKTIEIPGRVNIVISEPFKVVVDYAHTPDSLEKIYKTFKDVTKKQKLICVLGSCGGGRDKWKRPKMGAIAAQMCDKIILTNEDPYDEDPNKILNDIEKGLYRFSDYEKIIDRKEAIKKALSLAQPGDSVVITGKGREPWMCVEKGKKIPWDDCEIVREKLKELK
jgi:UDP-N-acetylmuramoyl-L-alanyl-D-glutamate--2,6-diaminopimelate ligase